MMVMMMTVTMMPMTILMLMKNIKIVMMGLPCQDLPTVDHKVALHQAHPVLRQSTTPTTRMNI
eukprot:12425820-Karenia_brevis.AAC.1